MTMPIFILSILIGTLLIIFRKPFSEFIINWKQAHNMIPYGGTKTNIYITKILALIIGIILVLFGLLNITGILKLDIRP
jgi:NADH:ubiquinone oxidoreductase subunit 5 (subunit L)/multisubunit Na+/H+ antiporter MnhA subunit